MEMAGTPSAVPVAAQLAPAASPAQLTLVVEVPAPRTPGTALPLQIDCTPVAPLEFHAGAAASPMMTSPAPSPLPSPLPAPSPIAERAARPPLGAKAEHVAQLAALVEAGDGATARALLGGLGGEAAKWVADGEGGAPAAPLLLLAARRGAVGAAAALLDAGCDKNARGGGGETALCVACREGAGEVVALLLARGASVALRTATGEGCMDMCQDKAVRWQLMQARPQLRSAVYSHADCMLHRTHEEGSVHQESPQRVEAMLRSLRQRFAAESGVHFCEKFDVATTGALQRAHSADYIALLRRLDSEVLSGSASVPFTPHVQRAGLSSGSPHLASTASAESDSSDTRFGPGSLKAALRAAGAAIAAVDAVLDGGRRNAFCCVRPPGHHAGEAGLMSDAVSCGFCLVNNVAVAAFHALSRGAERVAIVDFDVHHGNGTQRILEHRETDAVLFCSVHLYDSKRDLVAPYDGEHPPATTSGAAAVAGDDKDFEFYPGTGAFSLPCCVNAPVTPLWRFGQHRSTRGMSRQETPPPVPRGSGAWRKSVTETVVPALLAHKPSIILLSAGFDGAQGDEGNIGPSRQVGLDLNPEDFAWLTREINRVANVCCDGRVVSVLEGGYGRYTRSQKRAESGAAKVSESYKLERLAECVTAHVEALVGPIPLPETSSSESESESSDGSD